MNTNAEVEKECVELSRKEMRIVCDALVNQIIDLEQEKENLLRHGLCKESDEPITKLNDRVASLRKLYSRL